MPTRTEIQDTLAKSQEQVIAYFRGLSPEDLVRPCTENGLVGEAAWRPKDHLAHLTPNEQGVLMLIRYKLSGAPGMPGSLGTMSPEERQAWGNKRNQTYITEHYDDPVETLFTSLDATRQETLALLAQCTDEQLAEPIGDLFGPDSTLGTVFLVNAGHSGQHIHWINEGFHQ